VRWRNSKKASEGQQRIVGGEQSVLPALPRHILAANIRVAVHVQNDVVQAISKNPLVVLEELLPVLFVIAVPDKATRCLRRVHGQ
jgi:hypothetical protein